MDFSHWLNIEENLLLTTRQPARIQQLLDLSLQSNFHIGMVSDDFPLLSHLNLAENAALSSMYHQGLSLRPVLGRIRQAVEALDMSEAMNRPPALASRQETLKAMLLRCVANSNSVVLVNRPAHAEADALLKWLDLLPQRLRLWIVCLEKHAAAYTDFRLRRIAIEDARPQGVA